VGSQLRMGVGVRRRRDGTLRLELLLVEGDSMNVVLGVTQPEIM
jgi:hypothetical protein